MKTLNIASTLTNINDLYIAEAADMPYETAVIPKEKRPNPFIRFINSGWGVAVICALVAISVTLGILAAGRAAGPITTLPGAGPTHPTFAFGYSLDDQATYRPGDTLMIETEVKNLGVPFTVTGSSQEFSADAWLIPHGSTDVYTAEGRINGLFAYTEDYMVQTIDQGEVSKHRGIITIPEDAAEGDYDLVLSYKSEYQVFEKAVTVVSIEDTNGVTLHFSPNLSKAEYNAGESVTIDFSVRGIDPLKGDPYIQGGYQPDTYVLSAVLTLHGTETYDTSAIAGEIMPNPLANIANSNSTWRYYTATFEIPSNAIGGVYDLHLQYYNGEAGHEATVNSVTEGVLTVKGTHSRFDFNYSISPYGSTLVQGQSYTINTVVQNKGEPFTVTGSSMAFSAEAHLVHHDDPEKIIHGTFWYTEDVVTQEIATGQIGRHHGYFTIPTDAATGEYDLWLYYGDEYQVFENKITIITPGEVPPISTVNDYEAASTERLMGFTLDEFIRAWGQPGASDPDANIYYWRVSNQASYDYVAVQFDGNNVSESAQYAYVMKVTVLEARYIVDGYIVDDPRNLLVEPYRDRWNYQISLGLHGTSVEGRANTIKAGDTLYVAYRDGINETAPCHFAKVIDVTFEPPVP